MASTLVAIWVEVRCFDSKNLIYPGNEYRYYLLNRRRALVLGGFRRIGMYFMEITVSTFEARVF